MNEQQKHDWQYKFYSENLDAHWYICTKCKEEDWIASYGTLDQLCPKECKPK